MPILRVYSSFTYLFVGSVLQRPFAKTSLNLKVQRLQLSWILRAVHLAGDIFWLYDKTIWGK